jgi:hypothetical protein
MPAVCGLEERDAPPVLGLDARVASASRLAACVAVGFDARVEPARAAFAYPRSPASEKRVT